MSDQNNFIKFLVLFVFTSANIFMVWSFMIREEGPDWLNSQVAHQVSPYTITETDRGAIINNIVMGYEFKLPAGFKTTGARNFSFFLEEDGKKKCEIRHYLSADRVKKISSGDGKVVILFNNAELVFELVVAETEKAFCAEYLKQIEDSLAIN